MAQPTGPSIQVQFADFDGETSNMIWEPPLARIPNVGERLNIRHEGMTYFLEVESITNFVDCDAAEHSVTIDAKLVNSRPTVRPEAIND